MSRPALAALVCLLAWTSAAPGVERIPWVTRTVEEYVDDPASRKCIETLHPVMQIRIAAAMAALRRAGYPVVTAPQGGYRSAEEQDRLFLKGRDASGRVVDPSKVVTGLRGGDSQHNHGLAQDLVLQGTDGQPDFPATEKAAFDIARLARPFGLTWGSDPGATSIGYDNDHFQDNRHPFFWDSKALKYLPSIDIDGRRYPRLPDESPTEAAEECRQALRGVTALSDEDLERVRNNNAMPAWRKWAVLIQVGAARTTSVQGLDRFVEEHGDGIAPPGVLNTHMR